MAQPDSRGTGSVDSETMVNDTRHKRGRAAAPVLPDDLLLWEILVRLPAKEILRCRTACRSWRRLTCDHEFLLAHHHRQPSLPLVSFRCRNDSYASNASVDAFDLRRTPAVRRPILAFRDYNRRRNFHIHASCDGLLLLSLANGRFHICNPTTRQWLALPALTGCNVAALYRHRPSGEYRILYWKHTNKSTSSNSAAYHVLSVGSSEEPRYIGLPVASPSMKKEMALWLIRACETPLALLHDCMHWYASGSSNSKVIVFDTLVESFKWMKSPIATNSANLLEMDSTIGIGHTHMDGDTMIAEVWLLQDYKMEIWSSKYKIELPLVVMMEPCWEYKFCGRVVSENGDMLVSLRDGYYPSSVLFHCDSKGKLLEKFHRTTADPMVLGLCFKESLVRHVFFQRKDGGHVRVPRFFSGL